MLSEAQSKHLAWDAQRTSIPRQPLDKAHRALNQNRVERLSVYVSHCTAVEPAAHITLATIAALRPDPRPNRRAADRAVFRQDRPLVVPADVALGGPHLLALPLAGQRMRTPRAEILAPLAGRQSPLDRAGIHPTPPLAARWPCFRLLMSRPVVVSFARQPRLPSPRDARA